MPTDPDVLWRIVRGARQRSGRLKTDGRGGVEFLVVEGDSVVESSRHQSREPAIVLAEELRQAYLANGWSEDV